MSEEKQHPTPDKAGYYWARRRGDFQWYNLIVRVCGEAPMLSIHTVFSFSDDKLYTSLTPSEIHWGPEVDRPEFQKTTSTESSMSAKFRPTPTPSGYNWIYDKYIRPYREARHECRFTTEEMIESLIDQHYPDSRKQSRRIVDQLNQQYPLGNS